MCAGSDSRVDDRHARLARHYYSRRVLSAAKRASQAQVLRFKSPDAQEPRQSQSFHSHNSTAGVSAGVQNSDVRRHHHSRHSRVAGSLAGDAGTTSSTRQSVVSDDTSRVWDSVEQGMLPAADSGPPLPAAPCRRLLRHSSTCQDTAGSYGQRKVADDSKSSQVRQSRVGAEGLEPIALRSACTLPGQLRPSSVLRATKPRPRGAAQLQEAPGGESRPLSGIAATNN